MITIDTRNHQASVVRHAEALGEAYEANAQINLRAIAFENHHAPVFHAWLNLAQEERREALRDRYVFFSVCCQLSPHVADLSKQDTEKAGIFVASFMGDVLWLLQGRMAFSEEWFRGLDRLAGALTERNYLPEARQVVAIGLRTGVAKFPRISQALSVHAAYLDALIGRREKAARIALRLVRKPYLLPDRRELPRLYQKMMYILAASNHLAEYRLVLWKGVSSFHADAALRDAFVAQLVKTYRGIIRVFLHSEVPLAFRLPFLVALLAKGVRAVSPLAAVRADAPLRGVHRACLYVLDAVGFSKPAMFERMLRRSPATRSWTINLMNGSKPPCVKRILVTRAMGGLGDMLMMTPGLQALSKKYPEAKIDFAVPKSFHPIFEGLDAVSLLDINEDEFDLAQYQRWINLTHCPAGRVESRQYPNVRKNRIEIFARSMGIGKRRLRRTTGCIPFYRVRPDEHVWAEAFVQCVNPEGRRVIGVQPFAADSYRNWPGMEELVERLSADHVVLLFHHEDVAGFEFPHVVKVKETFRRCAALAKQCSRFVVVDSAFLHLSAALKVPTVAVFVATSGRVVTRHYPSVRLCVPEKKEFPCYPC
ncbi:MAG TPA: glycosyltransferase family 9 protein, partial [Nitrospira sp.]